MVIRALHLHTFEARLHLVGTVNTSDHIFAIRSSCTTQEKDLRYITSPIRLDNIVCPGKDDLFMIDGGILGSLASIGTQMWQDHVAGSPPVLFLILRHNGTEHGRIKQYKLVTARMYVLAASPVWWEPRSKVQGNSPSELHNEDTEGDAIDFIRFRANRLLYPALDLRYPATSRLKCVHLHEALSDYASKLSIKLVWQQIFPIVNQHEQLCEILVALCKATSCSDAALEMRRIILQANWDVRPRISANNLTFTFGPHFAQHITYYLPPIKCRMTMGMAREWQILRTLENNSSGLQELRHWGGHIDTLLGMHQTPEWKLRIIGLNEWHTCTEVKSSPDLMLDSRSKSVSNRCWPSYRKKSMLFYHAWRLL